MPDRARLRVYGEGEMEVRLVKDYLSDFQHAYNSLLVFEHMLDGIRRRMKDYPLSSALLFDYYEEAVWSKRPRRFMQTTSDWPPTLDQLHSRVPLSEQLILSGVQIASPGFWEFVGSLNPLETLRKYLCDRHERRKDREYREPAERKRLEMENEILRSKEISERIRLAKELGATDRDLAPLVNDLIARPLGALDQYQNRGLINRAEFTLDRMPKD